MVSNIFVVVSIRIIFPVANTFPFIIEKNIGHFIMKLKEQI
jgi:hypothetical protein